MSGGVGTSTTGNASSNTPATTTTHHNQHNSKSQNRRNSNHQNNNSNPTLSNVRNQVAHPHQQVTLTCYIPPSKIGAVIGRGGKTILGIQREASRRSFNHTLPVKMSIVGESELIDEPMKIEKSDAEVDSRQQQPQPSLWTPVIIRGDPCGAFAAANLLKPLVEEMDDVVLDVPIQVRKHAIIIGKKGSRIASLSADHNVRIMVPRSMKSDTGSGHHGNPQSNSGGGNPAAEALLFSEDQQHQEGIEGNVVAAVGAGSGPSITATPEAIAVKRRRDSPANVQLEGELENVENCLTKMLTCLSPLSSNNNSINKADQDQQKDNNKNKDEQKLHEETIEKIITYTPGSNNLPQMTKIRQVAKRTNTVIKKRGEEESGEILQEDERKIVSQLVISGKTSNVENAANILEKMMEEKKDQGQYPNTGKGGGRGRGAKSGRGGRGVGRGRGGRGRAGSNVPVPSSF